MTQLRRIGLLGFALLVAFAPGRAGSGISFPCTLGTASPTGNQPCTPCEPGTFAPGFGATECQPCPPDSFIEGPGAFQCTSRIVPWPGSAPCDDPNDLEACLANVRDGSIVEIGTETPPGQTASVAGKSFTLRPAPGVAPVFQGTTRINANGGDADVEVVIERVTFPAGAIRCFQAGEGTFRPTVRDVVIQNGVGVTGAIEISSGNSVPPYGPTEFVVEGNVIGLDLDDLDPFSGVEVGGFQVGGNQGTIRDNTIVQVGLASAEGITISTSNVTLDVDVIGNLVAGEQLNSGIRIAHVGDGSVAARLVNNAVSGEAGSFGATGAMVAIVNGGSGAFTVINNTLAFNEGGLTIGGTGDVVAEVANNLVAFNGTGMSFSETAAISNDSNLVFGNDEDFFVAGPGTIAADPLFVSEADLRLQPTSPARDAGSDAQVPPDVLTDLAGRPRISGESVDIGAYEVPEPSEAFPAAWLALAALALRRRA